MKRLMIAVVMVVAVMSIAGMAQAGSTGQWHTITFTGADLFNYSTNVDQLYNQDAPRRVREWASDTASSPTWAKWSDLDADADGTNDFAEWAQTNSNLSNYGFSYFNLWGETIAANYWDQPYHAVPDQNNGQFGADSWRNQTVNGVAVHAGMGSPGVWDGGIVLANQDYNRGDYAFPVWRAPTGTQLTMANAASLVFSVDVLMENYDTAFEPDGTLRVFFGGFDHPQEWTGVTTEIGGIITPVPEPLTMIAVSMGIAGLGGYIRRRTGRAVA